MPRRRVLSGCGSALALRIIRPLLLIMGVMRAATVLAICLVLLLACGKKGEQVYRTWTGADRASTSVVRLNLDTGVSDIVLRDRELPRSEYGTLLLAPGNYTLRERDDATIEITIRPLVIDMAVAKRAGELVLGHTYTLHAGKSDGKRALWIEDSRSGEVFIDTR